MLCSHDARAACGPRVELEGDATLIQEVQELLEESGVLVGAAEGCPAVRARVERRDGLIDLHIVDEDGRASERRVETARAAAALIETWAADHLSRSLLTPRHFSPDGEAWEAEPDPEVDAEETGIAGQLIAGVNVGGTFDASTWFGGELSGCLQAGPLCPGLLGRVEVDPELTGDSEMSETTRLQVGAVALLGWPLRYRDILFVPALGSGAAWVRSSSMEYDFPGHGERVPDEIITLTGWMWIIEARLLLAYRLTGGLHLALAVSVEVAPTANTELWKDELNIIARQPRGHVRGVVGLGYEF